MSVAPASLRQTSYARSGGEPEIVASLIRAVAEAGIQADPVSIINLYVALKSKPLAILAGPAQSGKIALVQSLARVLTGGDPLRCQMMIGHARWAGQTRNVALFTEAQTRLNADKLFALIEEAWQPENMNRVFMACLTRISEVELVGFFSEVAFQLRHGQIMRLPSIHLTEPIPYPPNLFLVGTMDDFWLDGLDADLLSQTTLIHWPVLEVGPAADGRPMAAASDRECVFLHSCIRSEAAARRKLHRILESQPQTIRPLLELECRLKQYAIEPLGLATGKAMIYLANAWSREGVGLFDWGLSTNFAIAADLAIAQAILPGVSDVIRRSTALRSELAEMMNGRYPRATAFLENLDRLPDRSGPMGIGAA